MQHVAVFGIVGLLFGLSVVFAWRQYHAVLALKTQPQLSSEDRLYFRRQAYRRFLGCVLMMILAVLIGGLFFFDILGQLDRINEIADEARARGDQPRALTEEEQEFLRFGMTYVAIIAFVLLVLMTVAVMDLMAIRRYGMRHRRRIYQDRRAMLERQLPELRRSRNGHN